MNWHKYHGSLSIRLPRYHTSMLPQPSDAGVVPFTGPRNNGQLLLDKQAPTLPPHTPSLNPSTSLNGLYSTRYFILFVGIKDWKPVQNRAWLGLFIQSCSFTQSVTESFWKQHPWGSHPLMDGMDVIPLGPPPPPPPPHLPPWRLRNSFKNTHTKTNYSTGFPRRAWPELSQNEPTF